MPPQRSGPGPDDPRPAGLCSTAIATCVEALRPHEQRDWTAVRARDLDWSVWDTVVHVADDLYFYAAQVLLADEGDYVCLEVRPDAHATPARLLAAVTVNAGLLDAAVATADPDSRGHHVHGSSDPYGFACMGVVEAMIHTYDAVHGLDAASTWRPPDELAEPVLQRLFPHAPPGLPDRPGDVLLHLCGRIPLGERPRSADWRWYGSPEATPTVWT